MVMSIGKACLWLSTMEYTNESIAEMQEMNINALVSRFAVEFEEANMIFVCRYQAKLDMLVW